MSHPTQTDPAVQPLPAGDPRHGTANGYVNLRCRCDECRSAWADYNRQLREKKKRRTATAAAVPLASNVSVFIDYDVTDAPLMKVSELRTLLAGLPGDAPIKPVFNEQYDVFMGLRIGGE